MHTCVCVNSSCVCTCVDAATAGTGVYACFHGHTAVSSCWHLCVPGSSPFGVYGLLSLALWFCIQSATAISHGKFRGVFSLVLWSSHPRIQAPRPCPHMGLDPRQWPHPTPPSSPHVTSAHHSWLADRLAFPFLFGFFPSCHVDKHNRVP